MKSIIIIFVVTLPIAILLWIVGKVRQNRKR
jgi:hypothetical protein